MPENLEKLPRTDTVWHSINVDVLLISSCIVVIVLLKLLVMFSVEAWFAMMPAGIEIMIAMEKPKATITNKALIFLLDMFRNALVNMPKDYTFTNTRHLIERRMEGQAVNFGLFIL
jgi:hypothetical protein